MISINQALSQAKKILSKTSQTPHLDAEVLLSHTLNTSREYILTYSEKILNRKQILKFNKLVTLRKRHTPIAYLINQKEFFGLNLKVNKNTLIPRPETESLVELATYNLQHVTNNKKTTSIIDIGTGSGNIIISVANYNKQPPVSNKEINYFGIDISKKALSIAKMNSKIHKFSSKIKFIKSDLLKYFIDHYSLLADNCIIIANLPYLSKAIYSKAMPDVRKFEPRSALVSGIDGLNHYRKLFIQLKIITNLNLKLQCTLIIEFSPEQKNIIEKLIRNHYPKATIDFKKDLAKKWRIAIIGINY